MKNKGKSFFTSFNRKPRTCPLCGNVFTPMSPRQQRCNGCLNYKCPDCGKSLRGTSLARLKANRERRCKECFDNLIPVWTRRHSKRYITIKTTGGWEIEHRFIVEKHLGRKLTSDEIVHHIDGNPQNNIISNLIVCKTLRDHLDNFHKDDLKNPPTHHFGKKKWGKKEYQIFKSKSK